jgi:fucose permease
MSRVASGAARLSGGSLLGLAYLAFISLGLPDALLGVAWPSMRTEFGVSIESVGLILTVGVTGYLLSSVSTGFALARLGVGWLLAGSTWLVALGLCAYAAAPLFPLALCGSMLVGLGSGAIDAGLNVYAAEHFGARHMNWLHASFGFGSTLGPLVITAVLGAGLSWRWGYGLTAAVQAVLAIAFTVTARAWGGGASAAVAPAAGPAVEAAVGSAPPDRAAGAVAAAETPAGAAEPESVPPRREGKRSALLAAPVWLGAATFALYTGTEVGVALWTFTLLTEGRGLSTAVAGTCVSAYWGALFVGRVLYGVVAERLPGQKAAMACIGGMAAGAVVIALPGPALLTVVGVMMIGAFAAPVFPLLTLTTAERVGAEFAGPAVGMQVGAASLGAVIFPGAIGLLVGRYGTDVLAPSFLVLAILMALLYLVTLRVSARR